MSLDLLPYALVFAATSVVCAAVAMALLERRSKAGGRALVLLMVSAAVWSFAQAAEALVRTVEHKVLCSQIEYLGYGTTPTFFLLFALSYTQQRVRMSRRRLAALWAMPAATLGLVWTNSLHGWVWPGFHFASQGSNVLTYGHGFWFWLFAAYSYLVTLCAAAVLAHASLGAGALMRRQLGSILVAAGFPFLTGGLYLLDLTPIAGMDISSLGFAAAGLTIAWSLSRFRLLDLVPVGRAALVQSMPDGLLVLDEQGHVAEINPWALQFFEVQEEQVVGRDAALVVGRHRQLMLLLRADGPARAEVVLDGASPCHLDVQVLPLVAPHRGVRGRLVVLRDVTERTLAHLERERVIAELQQALAQIRTLRGLLPICSWCKKVRDDRGYWTRIESYISEHSDADFTHSICPECAARVAADDDAETAAG